MKVCTHIHTHFSYDCIAPPKRVFNALDRAGVDFALVTDHDSFEGARAVRAFAKAAGGKMVVPFAAEILTEFGDVIIAFEEETDVAVADLKSFDRLVSIAKSRNGILILPHPYQSHTELDRIASAVDAIEVFNARCQPVQNSAAEELCAKHGKIPVYSTDAHFARDIALVTAIYESKRGISIFSTNAVSFDATRVSKLSVALSEAIGNIKRRRFSKLPLSIARVFYRSAKHIAMSRS